MPPTFASDQAWQAAEAVLQPSFIRLIDNLRQVLEASDWQHQVDQQLLWPEGTSDQDKQRWQDLELQLYRASEEEAPALEQELAALPTPQPVYTLQLDQGDRHHQFDLWELCWQLCCPAWQPSGDYDGQVDPVLLTPDGECDWDRLEIKTRQFVEQLLAQVNAASAPETVSDR
ncbi:hypothetical protein [Synechococcus elongatus]|uniref:DUF1817 domain-containing protein n=1 Tax=Synechococcus elongatus PCC 11802 TaxID=2283154 RepID=A0AAT9JS32_SYNEL|nr:hypothetical protein [Synechococcus elongatus]QFZ92960.1 hypothetical protein EKO22_12095 [Synechococcus elongatus PCC 11802]